ncbi:putative membrane protein [Haloarcula quadrata]|jgi:uncharacterized membrane protein|uniref:DUF502 domain-containing protein n=3 Tax=Haloarcula TaxID=2237 RepID=Q5UY66_HALMA|nr:MULTISPECIES: DUF502 domain-containing protein [Haloarcula]AAV47787.1 unknown [Haloarcula marismortui ATCC 43049]EMA15324.1 hypothetical protein C435_14393 [Haloarcula californiae ATCC 33799]NHN64547.1 DUF502 domain-containing protein [Haloarcula sp. JP-Z28]NHX39497.1 DUF502 domain-containing protein [Haloarcula sp. R1-2]QCP92468.1 DUF502 domain-containing protein [Haloarcula marismortui ATCC 43049]
MASSTSWKRDFASGLIILLPLLVTIYVILYLYSILASAAVIPAIDGELLAALGLPSGTSSVELARVFTTLIIFILIVFSIGYLMRTAFGDIVERAIDDAMNHVPGLRVVYNASKMAVETAVGGTEDLQAPVKLEVWDGMRMTAFKTGQTTDDGREVLFLPTAPNITTGYVVEVEPHRYEEIDERVEEALTRILSAGFGDTDRSNATPIPVADEDDLADD